jgi:phage/plasmid-like protein (TIGR03299 family)
MSHELYRAKATGKIEMAYAGETPWHGLGQLVQPGATIDQWLEATGMDQWTVRRVKPHYYADRAGTDLRTDDDMVFLIRSDSGKKLGYVSADYNVVQPREMLTFFKDLVAGSGFELETAGVLFGGKKFWALAKITQAVLSGWDNIGAYVLLSSSADGSRATEGREAVTRVVCHNTISMAWAEETDKIIRISHRERFDHKKVQQKLGMVAFHFDQFVEAANDLSKAKVSEAAAEDFILKLLRPSNEAMAMIASAAPADSLQALLQRGGYKPKDEESDDLESLLRRPRGADDILNLFLGDGEGSGRKGTKGTAWGLVNAVTEYVDHHASAKSVDHLLERAYWGSGAELKQDAMTLAVAEFGA